MNYKILFLLSLVASMFSACATYAPQFKDRELPSYPAHKKIEKTFYLVGDAGLSPMGGMSDALTTFQNFLKEDNRSDNYTIFLGDNIYPAGMDPQDHPRRAQSENMIDAQYRAVRGFDGQVIFIPGNHEWYNNGVVGVAREENYVESKFPQQDAFRPSNGCPLESVPVSKNIQLIIIDTQWFLEDWNRHPTINEGCDIKTREKFFLELGLELEKNQNKTIVFAMHHPMFTNGNHGGYFALQKHLYPLQKKIPMPGLASLVVQIRAQGGVSVQDRYNELYNKLMVRIQQLAKNNDRLVFVSGHDHNLQYIEKDGFRQIVSGAGSKESYAATGSDGFFSTGEQGFAVLDVFDDGSSWVRYFVKGKNFSPRLIFQKEVIAAPKKWNVDQYAESYPPSYTLPIYRQDSIREALFFKTIWGAKYKDAYSQPVTAPTASLDTLFGGLKVLREQKGADYNSLLLADAQGNRYRMRKMGKNALQISKPIAFEDSESKSIESEPQAQPSLKGQDITFYTASHPYAVMAIPDMARAINVFYTTPQLYYVPKQKRLGNYNETFGDELYFISVEPSEKSEGEGQFEYPDDVGTTDDILTKLQKTGEVALDEENYIKSRLFNMLIGNWNHSPDQWRWAEYYNPRGQNVYVPIPKNRDNAFSSFEGNILDLTRSLFNGTKQRHVYGKNLADLAWFNKEDVILDRALLKHSGRAQWTYLAQVIQDSISDAVIEKAFNNIPPEVRDQSLADIKEKLKLRKANLVDIANKYYTFLSTLQTIVGTDYDDFFEIGRRPDGTTHITSYSARNGIASDTLLSRTFLSKDTRELWVFGLRGKDTFKVTGELGNKSIYVRLIGGKDNDSYQLPQGKRVKVYDWESAPNTIVEKNKGSLRLTDVYNLNTYDYRKQINREMGLVSAIGYNPDDGFRAALQYVYRVDNFQRNPFSQKHIANAAFYTDINSYEISYSGEFANIKDDLNLTFGARYTSPNFKRNYFGLGNESTNFQNSRGFAYNRIGVQHNSAFIGLLRNSNFGSFYKLQATFDSFEVKTSPQNVMTEVFVENKGETSFYGTLEGIYKYRSYDDPLNPTIGMLFDLNVGVTDNIEDADDIFGFLRSRVTFYNHLTKNRKLVLRTDLRYAQNIGERYQFYQAASLGGDSGLRGYREQRFTGKASLVGGADLRYSLPTFKVGLVPIKTGIYVGADLGRVWIKRDDSQKWHNSRGGGFWLNGAGGLHANFSIFNSTEGTRLAFGLGFDF